MRARGTTWVSALVVLALLLTGCGGGDDKDNEADFKKDARVAANETSQIGQDLGTAIEGARDSTDAALASQFKGLTSRTREMVVRLKALDTPDSARREVDDLTEALDTGAKDLAAVTKAVGEHDAAAAKSATTTLINDSPAIKKANDALKAELRSSG